MKNNIDFYSKLKECAELFAFNIEVDEYTKAIAEMAFYEGGKCVWETECKKEKLKEQEKCFYAVVTFQTANGTGRKSYTLKTSDQTFPLMPLLKYAVKDTPDGIKGTFIVENVIEISHEQMAEHATFCEASRL